MNENFLKNQLDLLKERTTNSDIEWQDIAEYREKELGVSEHRDTVRKGSKLLYEYLDAGWELSPPPSILDKYQEEGYKIKDYTDKLELSRLLRKHNRQELFYEKVRNVVQTLPVPEFSPLPHSSENEIEYVLTISDIHYGSNFVSYSNAYSNEKCVQRMKKLFTETVNFVREHNIDKLSIIFLGDTINGLLRMKDLQINQSSVVESVVEVSHLIGSFLNELSRYVELQCYFVPSANHSQTRPLGSKANELASEDLEYVIGNYISDLLMRNQRVSCIFNWKHDYINIPIHDYNVVAMHGHTIKNIKDSLKDLSQLHRTFYDFVFLGHFHAAQEITVGEGECSDTEVIICPSFVGSDPYADKLMKGAKAACKIYGFDKKMGHVETYKIILN